MKGASTEALFFLYGENIHNVIKSDKEKNYIHIVGYNVFHYGILWF